MKPIEINLFRFPQLTNSPQKTNGIGNTDRTSQTTIKMSDNFQRITVKLDEKGLMTEQSQQTNDFDENVHKIAEQIIQIPIKIPQQSPKPIKKYSTSKLPKRTQDYYGHQEMSYKNYKYPKLELGGSEFEFLQRKKINQARLRQNLRASMANQSIEETLQQINLEKSILDYGESTLQDDFSKYGLLAHYNQKEDSIIKKRLILDRQLCDEVKKSQLNKSIKMVNKPSVMQKEWRSPFQTQTVIVPQMQKSHSEIDVNRIQNNRNSVLFIKDTIVDEPVGSITAIQMNQVLDQLQEIFKGSGPTLRTIFDRRRSNYNKEQTERGNPRYMPRADGILRITQNKNPYLVMLQHWNRLIKIQQVQPQKRQDKFFNSEATMSSISKVRNFNELSSQAISVKKISQQRKESFIHSQPTPMSVLPILIRNQSGESIAKNDDIELDLVKDMEPTEPPKGQYLASDVFLIYFEPFWQLIRKEDSIVERIMHALTKNDNGYLTFEGFKTFHRIFIHRDASAKQVKKFVGNFLMFKNEMEVPFIQIQGIINLLFSKIDQRLSAYDKVLPSEQILERIVEKIHRPQNITVKVLGELLDEERIPMVMIVELLFD